MKTLNFSYILGNWPLLDDLDFGGINMHTMLIDYET